MMHPMISTVKQTTLAACLTLQVDSFALRTRVPSSSVKQGFTLAELLIALALLGIIAAFTIPKVLQSSATQETNAKLRETVATLENAWYSLRAANQVQAVGMGTEGLWRNIAPSLNTVASDLTSVAAAGAPLASVPATHPCIESTNNGDLAWVQFANGVIVTGMTGSTDLLPPLAPQHNFWKNVVLCIDVNGAAGPNLPGQDVFFGTFNQYGAFTGTAATEQAALRSFRWGNASGENVLDYTGGILTLPTHGAVGDGTQAPCAVVGCRLTQ